MLLWDALTTANTDNDLLRTLGLGHRHPWKSWALSGIYVSTMYIKRFICRKPPHAGHLLPSLDRRSTVPGRITVPYLAGFVPAPCKTHAGGREARRVVQPTRHLSSTPTTTSGESHSNRANIWVRGRADTNNCKQYGNILSETSCFSVLWWESDNRLCG